MNPDITIHKLNEVYIVIECSEGIAYELREHFTFYVPGYQFMPAYKNKIWDGQIRLFDIRNKTLYKGLTHRLEAFCKGRNYHYTYDFEEFDNELSLNEAEQFINSLQHDLEHREYQLEAFAKSIKKKRLILLSPTASGKSKIIYDTIRYISQERKKGLLIVPRIQLVEQMYKDFGDYSTKNGWDVEEFCHRIYEGKPKQTDKPLTISTWQSIYIMSPQYFQQFDYVIGDEVHTFKSKSLTYIMSNLTNADYRIGLTGTLDGTLTHKLVLEGLFGPVHQVTTTKKLMDDKHVSNLKINCLVLKHPDSICQLSTKFKYQDEVEYLIKSKARNTFIKNLALSLEGNTLVMFQYVEKHGKELHRLINMDLPEGKKLHYIHGKTDVEVREQIRGIVDTSTNNIIVASFGTTSTGTNMPKLHNMIFAFSGKSRIKVLQSIGRILRTSEGKEMATLYDVTDDLRHKKKMNFTLKHFEERLRMYVKESFDYKIYKIKLKDK